MLGTYAEIQEQGLDIEAILSEYSKQKNSKKLLNPEFKAETENNTSKREKLRANL